MASQPAGQSNTARKEVLALTRQSKRHRACYDQGISVGQLEHTGRFTPQPVPRPIPIPVVLSARYKSSPITLTAPSVCSPQCPSASTRHARQGRRTEAGCISSSKQVRGDSANLNVTDSHQKRGHKVAGQDHEITGENITYRPFYQVIDLAFFKNYKYLFISAFPHRRRGSVCDRF